jgi:hypothetical protein
LRIAGGFQPFAASPFRLQHVTKVILFALQLLICERARIVATTINYRVRLCIPLGAGIISPFGGVVTLIRPGGSDDQQRKTDRQEDAGSHGSAP